MQHCSFLVNAYMYLSSAQRIRKSKCEPVSPAETVQTTYWGLGCNLRHESFNPFWRQTFIMITCCTPVGMNIDYGMCPEKRKYRWRCRLFSNHPDMYQVDAFF